MQNSASSRTFHPVVGLFTLYFTQWKTPNKAYDHFFLMWRMLTTDLPKGARCLERPRTEENEPSPSSCPQANGNSCLLGFSIIAICSASSFHIFSNIFIFLSYLHDFFNSRIPILYCFQELFFFFLKKKKATRADALQTWLQKPIQAADQLIVSGQDKKNS